MVRTGPSQQHDFLDQLASIIPSRRVGAPDEIAEAAVLLASDDASFVNSIELSVDGGQRQI
ncbi:SDR family oxidoreductase [Duganella sp. Leaf126]|uniref:SDR family oxidoreductase n=1 Tax=Duganella sp. Leaf126 TaxID=1736266 RepID=UPI0035A6E30B